MLKKLHIHKSLINHDIINEFEVQRGTDLFVHTSYTNNIDKFIAISYFLHPDILETKEKIFIDNFLKLDFIRNEKNEKAVNFREKDVEFFVETYLWNDTFLSESTKYKSNKKLFKEVVKIIEFFWQKRLNELDLKVFNDNETKFFPSIVKKEVYEEFEFRENGDITNFFKNKIKIDGFISASFLLCPNFAEINNYIIVLDFLIPAQKRRIWKLIEDLEKQHRYNKYKIENWINCFTFGDLFIGVPNISLGKDKILNQYGDILVYFWTRRLKEIFPTRKIVVEYGENIMGESVFAITVYENVS